jgi:hypothetical protein
MLFSIDGSVAFERHLARDLPAGSGSGLDVGNIRSVQSERVLPDVRADLVDYCLRRFLDEEMARV